MIVCICHGVNEREVRETITAGCSSAESIRKQCGAGDSCGSCMETLREILLDRRAHHGQSAAGNPVAQVFATV